MSMNYFKLAKNKLIIIFFSRKRGTISRKLPPIIHKKNKYYYR